MTKRDYSIPAVEKAVDVFRHLCESDTPLTLSELSRRSGIGKNMVFRLLHTLEKLGWVLEEAGRGYRVTLQPFHLFSKPVERLDVRIAGLDPLRALWEATGESCYLGVLDGDKVLFVEHLDSTRDVRTSGRIGGRYALHCCAPGKVLLAYGADSLVESILSSELDQNTIATTCDATKLRRELEQVRRQAYALDIEEYARGLMCFAAPVFDHTGSVAGTVGVGILTLHYNTAEMISELGPKVLEAADRISQCLGADAATRQCFADTPKADSTDHATSSVERTS